MNNKQRILTQLNKQRILTQLNKCGSIALDHRSGLKKLHAMIMKEYGVSYNDVDCDPIIDTAEIIGGSFRDINELDEALYGYSRVPKNRGIAKEELGEL